MKIRLNIDYSVALDGITTSSFNEGEVVDFPARIAGVLVGDGRASVLTAPSPAPSPAPAREEKAVVAAPENKMEPAAPATKAKGVVSKDLHDAMKAHKRNRRR